VAYVPDGGGGASTGIQTVHFEDTSGNLLPAAEALSLLITAPGSVEAFPVTSDGLIGAAVLSSGSTAPYHLVQSVFGVANASLALAGPPYDVAVAPTSAPSASISDITGVAILGTGSQSEAITAGGSNGLVGVTSLTAAPPIFGGLVPFSSSSLAPPVVARNNVAVSSPQGDGSYTVLVRGQQDTLSYHITLVSSGYQFTLGADNANLGTLSLLRGRGAMAISPANDTIALLAQAQGANTLALVNGLPNALTVAMTLPLPSVPHSVAFTPNGSFAAIGADGGVYIVAVGSSSSISLSSTLTPTYTGSDGATHTLANVASVSFTPDGRYLAALALLNPSVSKVGTVVVLPFNQSTAPTPTPAATGTPAPVQFTQSGLTTGGINLDSLTVR
jgi:WD40 repeat protein